MIIMCVEELAGLKVLQCKDELSGGAVLVDGIAVVVVSKACHSALSKLIFGEFIKPYTIAVILNSSNQAAEMLDVLS